MKFDRPGIPQLNPPTPIRDTENGSSYIAFQVASFGSGEDFCERGSDLPVAPERQRLLPFPDLPEFEEARLVEVGNFFLRVLINHRALPLDDVLEAWKIHRDLIKLSCAASPLDPRENSWDDDLREYVSGPIAITTRFDRCAGDWLVQVYVGDIRIWCSSAPAPIELTQEKDPRLEVTTLPHDVQGEFSILREFIDKELLKLHSASERKEAQP